MVNRKKPVGVYDELNQLYKRATEVMVQATGPLTLYVKGGYAKKAGDDAARVDRLASMLSRDIQHFSQQLNQLKAKHQGCKGRPRGVGQHFDAFNLGNEYIAVIEKMTTVLLPAAADITTVIQKIDKDQK